MKKRFCSHLMLVFLIVGFSLSASAAILPAGSRAFTGRITKIYKEKGKRIFKVRVQQKKEALMLNVPRSDPLKIMASIKNNQGKTVTVIYSFPDMTITAIQAYKKKKRERF